MNIFIYFLVIGIICAALFGLYMTKKLVISGCKNLGVTGVIGLTIAIAVGVGLLYAAYVS